MEPVGFIRSCFKFKNGTPRQSGICTASQASLTIRKEIYNNPEHSLVGLEQFSHVWILFIFHKNNNTYDKAKVKPPRLNGAKVGVFSTRSPYRFNPIGLTLAKIEKIVGDTLHLSGVDMLDGTPVVDVKPYISAYDQPAPIASVSVTDEFASNENLCYAACKGVTEHPENIQFVTGDGIKDLSSECRELAHQNDPDTSLTYKRENGNAKEIVKIGENENFANISDVKVAIQLSVAGCGLEDRDALSDKSPDSHIDTETMDNSFSDKPARSCYDHNLVGNKQKNNVNLGQQNSESSRTANWISQPPIPKLKVTFTPSAAGQLLNFSATSEDENFKLKYITEAETAIKTILQADPRSTYRRTKCNDRLYFFAVDCMHVTAWFNDDENIAEILRVKPVTGVGLVQGCNS